MQYHAAITPDAGDDSLSIVRTALHRAADLLERVQLDPPLEVGEALDLVFLALYELERPTLPGPAGG